MYAGSHDKWSVLHAAELPQSCWYFVLQYSPIQTKHTPAMIAPASCNIAHWCVLDKLKSSSWQTSGSLRLSLFWCRRGHSMTVCCWGVLPGTLLMGQLLTPGCEVYILPSPAFSCEGDGFTFGWVKLYWPVFEDCKISLQYSGVVFVTNFTLHEAVVSKHPSCGSDPVG